MLCRTGGCKVSIFCNSANVNIAPHVYVATLTPRCAPRITDDPAVGAIDYILSDYDNSMVNWSVLTGTVIKDS